MFTFLHTYSTDSQFNVKFIESIFINGKYDVSVLLKTIDDFWKEFETNSNFKIQNLEKGTPVTQP